eukprot:10098742-Prorocentrum_lima.AAC.1
MDESFTSRLPYLRSSGTMQACLSTVTAHALIGHAHVPSAALQPWIGTHQPVLLMNAAAFH